MRKAGRLRVINAGNAKPLLLVLSVAAAMAPLAAFGAEHAAAGAHGAEAHGEHHASILDLFWPLCNFVLYALLMTYAFRRLARPILRDRAVQVREHLTHAKRVLADAEQQYQSLGRRLREIGAEKQAEITRLVNEGKSIAANVTQSGQLSLEQLHRDTSRRVASELAKAQADIRFEVVAAAGRIARERIQRELSGSDDARLRKETVQALG